MAFNEQVGLVEVHRAASRTASVTSANIDRYALGDAQTFNFVVSVGTVTGTTPGLAISVEESDDGSTGWAAIPASRYQGGAAFTSITASGFHERTIHRTKRFLRVVQTITGTTPNFTYAILALAGDPQRGNI
jgi:hypothetical protein